MRKRTIPAALGAIALLATAAYAAVIFDAATGVGFVGKGDVQLVFGWNNKALQDNAANVVFRARSEVVTEVSWECKNSNNDHIQPRARTTTTSIEGVLASVARERNQITGFTLTGYDGAPTMSSDTDGPPVDSCPSGFWSLTTPAGDPVEVGSTNGLQVSSNGSTWMDLQ